MFIALKPIPLSPAIGQTTQFAKGIPEAATRDVL